MTELVKLYEPTSIELKQAKQKELESLASESQAALSIEITDKKSRELVHEHQMKLRDVRVDIEKARKDFTAWIDEQKKAAITIERDLISIISPIEDALKEKKDKYDLEQERKKQEEENKKQQLISDRTLKLAKYGVSYDTLTHSPQIMSELVFDGMIVRLESEFQEKEKARIAQEEADKKAREEFEAEQEKLRKEKEEFELEKKRIADEKQAIEQEKIDAENAKKRQEELEKAREEARLQAIKDAEIESERKRIEDEKKAREEQEALEKKKKYKAFCESIGLNEETAKEFTHIDTDEGRVFYKKVWVYK